MCSVFLTNFTNEGEEIFITADCFKDLYLLSKKSGFRSTNDGDKSLLLYHICRIREKYGPVLARRNIMWHYNVFPTRQFGRGPQIYALEIRVGPGGSFTSIQGPNTQKCGRSISPLYSDRIAFKKFVNENSIVCTTLVNGWPDAILCGPNAFWLYNGNGGPNANAHIGVFQLIFSI